jgi:hypothetical protein
MKAMVPGKAQRRNSTFVQGYRQPETPTKQDPFVEAVREAQLDEARLTEALPQVRTTGIRCCAHEA